MSLSTRNTLQNPATKFLEWKGGDGSLIFYDKSTKQTVEVELPVQFIILDRLATIKGFSKPLNGSIASNEVRSTKKEELSIICFSQTKEGKKKTETLFTGFYDKIKGDVKAAGGKFCNSVYAAIIDGENNLELVNFQFFGAALVPFIESGAADDGMIIEINKNPKKQKNGSIEFYQPEFKKLTMAPEELLKKAEKLDIELQTYLTAYFMRRAQQNEVQEIVQEEIDTTQDLPEVDINEIENLNVQMPF